MANFSHADKLALMLTSAGSQRKLSAYLGCTHQQIGRWLKGEQVNQATGLITNRPPTGFAAAIDAAFPVYREQVRKGAAAQGLRYTPDAPVFAERLNLTMGQLAGTPGLRVLIRHTDKMSPDLLDTVIKSQADTGRFFEVSVRSLVDLKEYFEEAEERNNGKRRGKHGEQQHKWRGALKAKLDAGVTHVPMWTKRSGLMTGPNAGDTAIRDVRKKLRESFEPATSSPGAKLADQVIFTLRTSTNGKPAREAKKQTNKAAGKNQRRKRTE